MYRLFLFVLVLAYCSFSCQSEQANAQSRQAVATPVSSVDTIPENYTVKGSAPVPPLFAPMMGQWVSTYDELEVLHFLPGKYTTYYDGQKVVEENMSYHAECPKECAPDLEGEMDFPCFMLEGEYGKTCFALVEVSENELQLSMLGGRGNTLVYKRLLEQ